MSLNIRRSPEGKQPEEKFTNEGRFKQTCLRVILVLKIKLDALLNKFIQSL